MKLYPSRYKDIQLTHQNHVITVQPSGSESAGAVDSGSVQVS